MIGRFCILPILIAVFGNACGADPDCDGCSDSFLSRYPDSQLVGYDRRAFEQAQYPITRTRVDDDSAATHADTLKVSGRRTQLFYWEPEGRSGLEVYSNYRHALTDGMTIVWSCSGSDECGNEFAQQAAEVMHLDLNNTTEARQGTADAEEPRYVLAKSQKGQSEVYIGVLVADLPLHTPPRAGAYVMVTEVKAMESGMITADAKVLEQKLAETHKAVIYGIQFDFDEATIKPESKPQLDEIAKTLSSHPQIKLLIVGHTDDQGGAQYNLALSRRRADAVVTALVSSYGITADRLTAQGKGASVPIASNDTEEGRSKNRRVELVEQVEQ